LNSLVSFYPLFATLGAYLVGSLSFAVIVSQVMGLNDPRTYGSKNPGATNVLRSGSKAAAVVTLLLDAFKGWLPVMLVKWFGEPYGLGDGTVAMVGLAAFLGHLFPVFFRCVAGHQLDPGSGDRNHLAGDRVFLSLLFTGVAGCGCFCTGVLHLWRWGGVGDGQEHCAVHRGDVAAADLASRRKHRAFGQRHRVPVG
jgi:hypothetical protein